MSRTVHLPPALHTALKHRAIEEGRPLYALLADAVAQYLKTPRRTPKARRP